MVKLKKIEVYVCECGKEYVDIADTLKCCDNLNEINSYVKKYLKKFNREFSKQFPGGKTTNEKLEFYKRKIEALENIAYDTKSIISSIFPRPYGGLLLKFESAVAYMNKSIASLKCSRRIYIERVHNERRQKEISLNSLSKEELIAMLLKR